MILLDTSVWIEYLKASNDFYSQVSFELEQRNILAFECIFGELLQGCKTQKEENIILSFWSNLPKIFVTELWIKAGEFSFKNKISSKGVGLIDVAIYLATKENKAKLWTLDKKLKSICEKNDLFIP